MHFNPDYSLKIIKDEEFPTAVKVIENQLENCRVSGFFDTFDGKKIYYEYFLAENSKASVIIVHGLSEFTKKFYEITYYFLNQGYNVFLYDQRCHGLSDRLTDRIELIHVDSFKDYVCDLSVFIDKIVLPAENKPLYIYSHSMGGAITAMYLAENSEKIKKAVLSAPLIEPFIGKFSLPSARFGIGMCMLLYGKKTKSHTSGEFNPERARLCSKAASKNRFLHNLNMRCENPNYRSTPMTYGWVYNSLILEKKFLKRTDVEKIKTPLLLLCAEKDTVVKAEAQRNFSKNCKNCTLVVIKNTDHSMLTATHDALTEHIIRVLDFYRD